MTPYWGSLFARKRLKNLIHNVNIFSYVLFFSKLATVFSNLTPGGLKMFTMETSSVPTLSDDISMKKIIT